MINIKKGNPAQRGAQKTGSMSYNFAFAGVSDNITLLIFDGRKNLKCRVELDETYKTGDVFSCNISGENLDKAMYCYESDGKMIPDLYAKTVTCCSEFNKIQDNARYLSRIVLDEFDWEGDMPLQTPYEDSIFYKIHVRGYTKSRTSMVKHKGTFDGIIQKADYLKELGITAVELMPAYEFDEAGRFPDYDENEKTSGMYKMAEQGRPLNYWGYCNALHFAPKASFTSCASYKNDYTYEFKNMVKQLHKKGIEVIMEMYFSDETPELITDCIRYWVMEYHIDGVHLYGPPCALNVCATDPVLSYTKIITVFWDGKRGHVRHMADYNDGYLGIIRRFLKGDDNQLEDFINTQRNNPQNAAVINYITNHNGFTLNDCVSYDRKHNEANHENNRDGESFNYSWNCGFEGRTKKKKVLALREKQMKNALMMLMFSAGTPLIFGGDEFLNSQLGNNNPYCLDNEISWVNWNDNEVSKRMTEFVKKLISFRKKYNILHMKDKLLASDSLSCGYPDISYHGSGAWYQVTENYNRHIGIMYCTKYSDCKTNAGKDDEFELIYIAYNMHWEAHELALPKISESSSWNVKICSADDESVSVIDNRTLHIAPRTSAVLTATIKNIKNIKRGHREYK